MDDAALEHKSLFCLAGVRAPDGSLREPTAIRKACLWLNDQKWYGNLILVLILVNCVILAMQTPTFGPAVACRLPGSDEAFDPDKHNCADSTDPTQLFATTCQECQIEGLCSCNGPLMPGFDMKVFGEQTEMFFTVAFSVEAISKIIALGFCMHKGSYLRNGWNWLDWVVVVMSWLSLIPGVGNFSAIRTVRVFRPLRTMSRIPGMGVIVGALMRSMIPLWSVVMLCTAIFFLFGILASQVWTEMPKVYCEGYQSYRDVNPWLNVADDKQFVCHSLDSYLMVPALEETGEVKRCGCDQLSGECDLTGAPTCQGYHGVEQKKMHWFEDGVGVSVFAPEYADKPQSYGLFVNDTSLEAEITNKAGELSITEPEFEYPAGDFGCGCGEICTTHLEFYCDAMGTVSFDHIGHTMMTIFQCVTLEGWTDIMYQCSNLKNQLSGSLAVIYWCALILFAGLFVINIALAVIADAYAESEKAELAAQKAAKRLKLMILYDKIDADGSGSVSSQELKEGLLGEGKYSGIVSSEKEVDDIIARGDADGDGELSLDEFIACFPDLAEQVDENEKAAQLAERRAAKGKNAERPHTRMWKAFKKWLVREPETQNKACFKCVETMVNSGWFSSFIMLFIGINTALLAWESHNDADCNNLEMAASHMGKQKELGGVLVSTCQLESMSKTLELANVLLSLFFLGEMLLKLWGLGFVVYISDSFNIFDAVIVITSMIELILAAVNTDQEGGGFITVLRAGRLFRIFKLARKWEALQQVIRTVTRSVVKIVPLSIILLLFMFIFSLLGMQMYGGYFLFVGRAGDCYSWEDVDNGCAIPRASFDNFGVAMVTIFQMMTGEDWNMVMYDGIGANGGSAFLYFAIIVVIGNFLILNLFLTILLSGFEEPEDDVDPEAERQKLRDDLWELYDKVDADKSGSVSSAELKKHLVDGGFKTDAEVDEMFATGDKNKDGELSFNEFIACFPDLAEVEEEEPEGPGLLRRLLCCLKTTQEPDPATTDLGLSGAGAGADDGEGTIPDHKAFFILGKDNPIRKFAFAFTNNKIFENIVLFTIIVSSLTLAYQSPTSNAGPYKESTATVVLTYLDLVFLIIFTVEMFFKHLALGFAGHPRAYWRDPWNCMDGFIVIMAYVGLLAADLPQLKPLRAIRTMRALRPLRALKMFPGMKIAVNCLLRSIPLMVPISMVSFLFFFVFAILGLQLYSGKLWYCETTGALGDAQQLLEDLVGVQEGTLTEVSAASIAYVMAHGDETCHNVGRADCLSYEDVRTSDDVLALFPYMSDAETLAQAKDLLDATSGSPNFTKYEAGDEVYQWGGTNVGGDLAGRTVFTGDNPSQVEAGYDIFCQSEYSLHGSACTRAECRLTGGTWTNQMTHFDNVWEALLCLFEMSTTEGWPTVMWNAVDAGKVGRQPFYSQTFSNISYFVLFLVVGNFFVLNLFVGSVIDNYLRLEAQAKEEAAQDPEKEHHAGDIFLTDAQKASNREMREQFDQEDEEDKEEEHIRPNNGLRSFFFTIVENGKFDALITTLIIVNIIIMAMKHRDMSPDFEDKFMAGANWVFTIAFLLEAVFKLTAWFPRVYFSSGWNQFDFFLVVVSIVSKIFDFGSFATMFRVFRVLRIIKLIKRAKELKRLMQTILISLPALANVGSLLLLLFFIYAILGVQFFFSACGVPPYFAVGRDGSAGAVAQETRGFDPCSDVELGYGFDGFVSANLKHNVALWSARASDENGDDSLTKVEFEAMAAAAGISLGAGTAGDYWDAATASATAVSLGSVDVDVSERTKVLALFDDDAFFTIADEGGFHRWAAGGDKPYSKSDSTWPTSTDPLVGGVEYVEKSAYITAIGGGQEGSVGSEEDLRWLPALTEDPPVLSTGAGVLKGNALWCTELTLKCDGYVETEQNLMDEQAAAPDYAECSCEDVSIDANFDNFKTSFITLIRVSTGEFWNGIMHELMGLGHTFAFLYFASYLVLAQFIMLNLVVAVLLINYDDQQAKDRAKMAAEAEADAAENGATSAAGGEKYAVSEEDKAAKLPPLEGKKPSAGESTPADSPSDPEAPPLQGDAPAAGGEGP